jgi:hypothetical protein
MNVCEVGRNRPLMGNLAKTVGATTEGWQGRYYTAFGGGSFSQMTVCLKSGYCAPDPPDVPLADVPEETMWNFLILPNTSF